MIELLKNQGLWPVLLKHIIGWSVFISYEIFYIYLVGGTLSKPQNYILNYSLNIILFYFNAHVVLNLAARKLRAAFSLIFILVVIEIAVFVVIKYPINALILSSYVPINNLQEYKTHITTNAMRTFYIVGFSTAYWFASTTIQRNKEIALLERQKLLQQNEKILLQKDLLKSRNAYLQAQVNPHLLFNTLNFMYNASAKVSAKLAEAVMTLSEIMRYALTNIEEDAKVPLEHEINHINNYIQLNQIRYDEKLNIEFNLIGEASDHRIIPLALITIVENVFKYGDLLDPQQPAKIALTIKDYNLRLSVVNKKRANQRLHGHGTGIANLKERLEIFYPEAYVLDINATENTYELTLNLTLNE